MEVPPPAVSDTVRPGTKVTITWARGKTVARRGAYTVHTMIPIRSPVCSSLQSVERAKIGGALTEKDFKKLSDHTVETAAASYGSQKTRAKPKTKVSKKAPMKKAKKS